MLVKQINTRQFSSRFFDSVALKIGKITTTTKAFFRLKILIQDEQSVEVCVFDTTRIIQRIGYWQSQKSERQARKPALFMLDLYPINPAFMYGEK